MRQKLLTLTKKRKRTSLFIKLLVTALTVLFFLVFTANDIDSNTNEETKKAAFEDNENLSNKDDGYLTISMVGDICFTGIVDALMKKYGDEFVFEKYDPYIKSSDIVFGNLETAISKRGKKIEEKQYTFRSRPATAKLLKNSNFTAVSIANNHVLDFGRDAFNDTLKYLKDNGVLYVGGGVSLAEAQKPVIIQKEGLKVGFLAFSKVIPYIDWYAKDNRSGIAGAYKVHEASVLKIVNEAKKQCDVLVVSVHWGKEASTIIRKEEVELAHKMVDSGADVIMGHHPHVVQGIEIYKSKPIFYSLGNFVFNPSKIALCNQTMLAQITYKNDGTLQKIEVIPGVIKGGQPVPITGKDKDKFMQYLNRLNINIKL